MSSMFSGCYKLSSLPDISNWDTNNVINTNYMFDECYSLSKQDIPNIFKNDHLI